jgi:diacylglycerol kinase (ATP)
MSRTFVILNPNSGRGRGRRLEPQIRAVFGRLGAEIGLTEGPGDEDRLARRALAQGFDQIVAVGGDGTTSNIGHAILTESRPAALGLVPGGTGCDLARSLGIPRNDLEACAQVIAAGKTRSIDVGKVEDRHFLNVAGFGFDIAVLERSFRVKWLRGELLYLYCALLEMKAYPGFELKSVVDGEPGPSGAHMMVIVANAREFGGGFAIAPQASLDDGEFEIVTFGDLGFLARLRAMGALMKGIHNGLEKIATRRASRAVFQIQTPPAFETDGEWRRSKHLSLTIEKGDNVVELRFLEPLAPSAPDADAKGGPLKAPPREHVASGEDGSASEQGLDGARPDVEAEGLGE